MYSSTEKVSQHAPRQTAQSMLPCRLHQLRLCLGERQVYLVELRNGNREPCIGVSERWDEHHAHTHDAILFTPAEELLNFMVRNP
jgi:hypothetical protein